jgi:hypothetical protein
MTNPCSPYASQPIPGYGTVVVFDAVQLANFFSQLSMGWLSPFALQIGPQSVDLTTFCVTDPPTEPTQDPGTIAGWFLPTDPTGAASLKAWIQEEFNYLLWFQVCQCSGNYPVLTQPTPTPAPTGVSVNPPALTNNGSSDPCYVYVDNNDYDLGNGSSLGAAGSQTNYPAAGITGVQFTIVNSIRISPGATVTYHTKYISSGGSVLADVVGSAVAPGATATWFAAVSAYSGTAYMELALDGTAGTGGADVTPITWNYYCGSNTPTTQASPCCPPDDTTTNTLSYILQLLEYLIANQPAPVTSYVTGAAYTGLSGTGTQSLADTCLAIRIDVTTIPSIVGENSGTPDFYFNLGYITPVTGQGPVAGSRVIYSTQVVPVDATVNAVDYTLENGTVITITELVAG